MKKIKMLALDIDGTLLNSELKLSSKNKASIQKAQANGIKITLCTGRPFNGIRWLIDDLGLDNTQNEVVTYNGAVIQRYSDGKISYKSTISLGHFKQINSLANEIGLGIHAMGLNNMYTFNTSIHPLTVRESYLGNLPINVINPNIGQLPEEIIKLMVVGNPEKINHLIPELKTMFGEMFSITRSEDFYLEIMAKNQDKAQALKLVLEKNDYSTEELMAIGNNENDIRMIELARVGVAVENSIPQLKKVSNYITSSNDQNGVAHAIEHLLKEIAI